MPSSVRGRGAVLALAGLVVAAVLAGSGWLLVGPGHARSGPPVSRAATSPRPPPAPSEAVSSAAPAPAPTGSPEAAVQPARLVIPRLSVQAPVENKGIDSHNVMEAPDRPFDVAWYPFTAMPGSGGNAVFAGHKDFAGVGPAIFWRLSDLAPGDVIEVVGGDQKALRYRVIQTWEYDVVTIPMASVLAQGNGDQVTLITCSGSYSRGAGYEKRYVVRAQRAS